MIAGVRVCRRIAYTRPAKFNRSVSGVARMSIKIRAFRFFRRHGTVIFKTVHQHNNIGLMKWDSPHQYELLLQDELRNDAYREAIRRHVGGADGLRNRHRCVRTVGKDVCGGGSPPRIRDRGKREGVQSGRPPVAADGARRADCTDPWFVE